MIRWSPGAELANLHGAMDRLYEDFFGATPAGQGTQRQPVPTFVLPLDISELENGFEIQAPVPGFNPEDVEITFSEGVLRIEATRPEPSNEQRRTYIRREVAHGHYQRTIQLPGDIREEEITAGFENGLLTVMLPKAPKPQPTRIMVAGKPQKQVSAKGT